MRLMRSELYKRRAIVRVDRQYVDELPVWFRKMMSKIVVLRVEHRMDINAVEFFALSELFDHVDDGCLTPEVKAIIAADEVLRFERC
jgi:hypothetical protein